MPQHIDTLSLTAEEKQKLDRLKAVRSSRVRHYPSRAVREHSRLEIIETVALAEGNLIYKDITNLLGVTRPTIARALHAFRKGGWDGLFGYWENSKNPSRRPSLRRAIQAVLKERRGISDADVAAWLKKKHKIKRKPKSMGHLRIQLALEI
jgi:transposase